MKKLRAILAAVSLAASPALFAAEDLSSLGATNGYASQRYLGTGKGVTIAVLDAGIDAKHPSLAGAVSAASDFTGEKWLDDVIKQPGHGTGIAGILADLAATNEPVLAITAHAPHRAGTLRDRTGGFAICSWQALEDEPALVAGFLHLVVVDPPSYPAQQVLLDHLSGEGWTHLAWGEPELGFAVRIHQWNFALRDPLAAVYRALRAVRHAGGEACEALLRGEGPQPRSAALAGRLVRVLAELDLVVLDREGSALRAVEATERTALERSAAFRAYHRRLEDGLRYLSSDPIPVAA